MDFGIAVATAADSWKVARRAEELGFSIRVATEAGVARERIIADPGVGFAKRPAHSYGVLARLSELAEALAAQWAAMRIGLVQKHDVQPADVGVHRDVVARQILGDERPVARVNVVLLDQR